MSKTTNMFAAEVRERTARMAVDHQRDYPSRWAAVVSIAEKIGYVPQTLHVRVKKAEVIHRRGPWRSIEAAEYTTLEWIDWVNHRRLLEPIGNIPPAEAEDQYYAARPTSIWQRDSQPNASGRPSAVQYRLVRSLAARRDRSRPGQDGAISAVASDAPSVVIGQGRRTMIVPRPRHRPTAICG